MGVENFPNLKKTTIFHFHDCGRKSSNNIETIIIHAEAAASRVDLPAAEKSAGREDEVFARRHSTNFAHLMVPPQ